MTSNFGLTKKRQLTFYGCIAIYFGTEGAFVSFYYLQGMGQAYQQVQFHRRVELSHYFKLNEMRRMLVIWDDGQFVCIVNGKSIDSCNFLFFSQILNVYNQNHVTEVILAKKIDFLNISISPIEITRCPILPTIHVIWKS